MFMIPKTFSSVNLSAQILFIASSFIHKKKTKKQTIILSFQNNKALLFY